MDKKADERKDSHLLFSIQLYLLQNFNSILDLWRQDCVYGDAFRFARLSNADIEKWPSSSADHAIDVNGYSRCW